MNIAFDYLYRDGGNYKFYNSIIFKGVAHLPLRAIHETITANLYQRIYFVPELLHIPRLKFDKYDSDLDHIWHEFDGIAETTLRATDNRNITEIMEYLTQKPQFLWFEQEFIDIEKRLSLDY